MKQLCKQPYDYNHHWMNNINNQRGCSKPYNAFTLKMQDNIEKEIHTRQQKYIHTVMPLQITKV